MNLRLVLKIVGRVLLFESLTLLPPLGVALWYGEDPMPFVSTFVLVAFLGAFLASLSAPPAFFARESWALTVAWSWEAGGVSAAPRTPGVRQGADTAYGAESNSTPVGRHEEKKPQKREAIFPLFFCCDAVIG